METQAFILVDVPPQGRREVKSWLLSPLLLLALHTAEGVPWTEAIVVSAKPLELFSLSDQRDSLVSREARKQGVPVWLALSISHAENWMGLDSTATNPFSGAIGLMQIIPANWDRYPECGDAHITNRKRNVCMGIAILSKCLSPTLALTLNCYGGATSLLGKRSYNLDVARKMRLEWLD